MTNIVSVIIPVYNVEKYLAECLDSIVNQTYKNLEIICINDCSPDNSGEILKDYASRDNRIKIIEHQSNKGLSISRNEGLEAASGDYIYIIDSDDWIDSDYIEKMVNTAKDTDADIVVNKNILAAFPDKRNQLYEHQPEQDIELNSYIDGHAQIHKIYWVIWNKLYKASFLKKNKFEFPVGYVQEDMFFHYVTFAKAYKIFYTEGGIYHYRDRDDSISKIQYDKGANCIKIFSLLYDYFEKNNLLDEKMKIYFTHSWFSIKNEQIYDEFKKYFCKAIDYLNSHNEIYNEMDLYFANNIVNSKSYQDYVSKYPQSAALSYIRRKKELISVIIPVYNAEKYLSRCLNSLISQTFKDFEVICINDKSSDNSLEILKEFSKKDGRIKVIDNEKNLGAAFTRNAGMDIAKGKYIYFIDADDYIDEKYLECMVQKIEQKDCDVVLNLSIYSESNGNSAEYKHPSVPEINIEGEFIDKITNINDFPGVLWARLYKKSFLNEHNLRFFDICVAEDFAFNTIVNMYADKTFVFYGAIYHYVVNDSSLIGTAKRINDIDLQHIKAHLMIYDYLKEHAILDDRLKLFRVYPFLKVDSSGKFDLYKKFFEKIEEDFHQNENIYNEMEKYFAYSILNSSSYEKYLKNYNKVVTMGFLRRKVRV